MSENNPLFQLFLKMLIELLIVAIIGGYNFKIYQYPEKFDKPLDIVTGGFLKDTPEKRERRIQGYRKSAKLFLILCLAPLLMLLFDFVVLVRYLFNIL